MGLERISRCGLKSDMSIPMRVRIRGISTDIAQGVPIGKKWQEDAQATMRATEQAGGVDVNKVGPTII
jgi:hypothetical protein